MTSDFVSGHVTTAWQATGYDGWERAMSVATPRDHNKKTCLVSLVEHTQIHQIKAAVERFEWGEGLRWIDFLNVLHLAERILFSHQLALSGFESLEILNPSLRTVDALVRRGCLRGAKDAPVGDQGQEMSDDLSLVYVQYTEKEYRTACHAAAGPFLSMLEMVTPEALKAISARMASAMPAQFGRKSRTDPRFFIGQLTEREVDRIGEDSLQRKANGAFDCVIASRKEVRDELQKSRWILDTPSLGLNVIVLEVLMRVAINEALGGLLSGIYAPCPERAYVVAGTYLNALQIGSSRAHRTDEPTKREGEDTPRDGAKRALNELRGEHGIPLTLFAIRFLSRQCGGEGTPALIRAMREQGPLSFLADARKLRMSTEVRTIRDWLAEHVLLRATRDPDALAASQIEGRDFVERYLNRDHVQKGMFSLFRQDLEAARSPRDMSRGTAPPGGYGRGETSISPCPGALLSDLHVGLIADNRLPQLGEWWGSMPDFGAWLAGELP